MADFIPDKGKVLLGRVVDLTGPYRDAASGLVARRRTSRRAPNRGVVRSLVLRVVPAGLGGHVVAARRGQAHSASPPGHPRNPAAPRAAQGASEKTHRCSPPAARAAQSQMHVEPTLGTRVLDVIDWMEGKKAGV